MAVDKGQGKRQELIEEGFPEETTDLLDMTLAELKRTTTHAEIDQRRAAAVIKSGARKIHERISETYDRVGKTGT